MAQPDISSMFSVEAEGALLGGVLLSPEEFENVSSVIGERDFFRSDHRLIFRAMAILAEQGETLELGLVADKLHEQDPDGDWWSKVAQLARNTASSANVSSYAQKVRQYANVRALYRSAADIQATLVNGGIAIEKRIIQAQQAMVELDSRQAGGPVKASDALRDYYAHVERCNKSGDGITGLTTGFANIDKRFSGFQPSQLVVLAARPSMGKTVLGLNIARHVGMSLGKPVLYFSLEMAKEELFDRMVSDCGNIPFNITKTAQYNQDDMDYGPRFNDAFQRIHGSNFYVDDQAGTSINEITARSRRLHRMHGLSLIVVDHLHLVHSEGESETAKVANVSRSLKRLAKSLSIPVLALCQLNRGCDQRPDKRPLMSDLRQSGSIEEDADFIGFIYRDVVYNPNTNHPYLAEVIWRKARSAEIGTDWFNAQLQYQRFVACEEPVESVPFQNQRVRGFGRKTL